MVFPWKPPFSYGFPGRVVSSHEKTWQLEIPYWFNNGISHIFDGGLYWWMGSNVNITYNGYLMLILILLVITSEYCYVWFAKGSLKIGDALPVDALMWLKQCHKPSPSHHHFYRWYGYHSQMGGLWLFYPHSNYRMFNCHVSLPYLNQTSGVPQNGHRLVDNQQTDQCWGISRHGASRSPAQRFRAKFARSPSSHDIFAVFPLKYCLKTLCPY